MMKRSISVRYQDLMFVLRKGSLVFTIFLIVGGIISYEWFNHIKETMGVPIYNRSIKIDLNQDGKKKAAKANLNANGSNVESETASYKVYKSKTPVQFELYNISKNNGVTLKEEREAYSDLLKIEMEGPLKVTRFNFNDEGLLRLWVNVQLYENDPRIAKLIEKLNLERSRTILLLEKKLYVLGRKSIHYNAVLNQLIKMDENGKNEELIKLIKDEIHFVKVMENEIKERMPVIRQSIATPAIERGLPVPVPVKSLAACTIATFLCAILSGLLTGMGLLIKKRNSFKV